jgi:hypothetical protein
MQYHIFDDWDGMSRHQEVLDQFVNNLNLKWFHHIAILKDDRKVKFFSYPMQARVEDTNWIPTVVEEGEFNLFQGVRNLIMDFCKDVNMPVWNIGRSNCNITYPQPGYPPIHLDHPFPYSQILIYLNDDFEGGDTLLFEKTDKFTGIKNDTVREDLREEDALVRISPKKNRIVVFNGAHWHTSVMPKDGARYLLVNTIIHEDPRKLGYDVKNY